MSGTLSTKTVRMNFEAATHTALRIWGPVRRNAVWNYESINESAFHPRVALKIIGLAFLSAVSAWEEYLAAVFLRYMAAGKSESGYSPILRVGACKSAAHSLQVLTGSLNVNEAARFAKWNDYHWVLDRAQIFFRKGEPFSRVPTAFQQRLSDAFVIRNRIAHSSSKARNQFKRMVNKNAGAHSASPMEYGFSPGKYLTFNQPEIVFDKAWIDSKPLEWPDIFEAYMHMFWDLIEILSP